MPHDSDSDRDKEPDQIDYVAEPEPRLLSRDKLEETAALLGVIESELRRDHNKYAGCIGKLTSRLLLHIEALEAQAQQTQPPYFSGRS